MNDLSIKQQQLLALLVEAVQEGGRVPTVRELAAAMGVKAPGTIQDHLHALELKGYIARQTGKSRNIVLTDRVPLPDPSRLPVVGRIAAGRPIEAIESVEYLHLHDDLQLAGTFLLRVKGESMIEDHIADGDYVVVKPQATARNGEIVVALLPGGEATLKRFYRERDCIRLQPANSGMEPILVQDVMIQGRVVAVIRPVH